MKIYEKDVVDEIIKYLKFIGIKDIQTEVPMYGASIDIAYIDENNKFVCVEVKLNDWRKVIEQAKHHLLITNQVYVIMPYPETEYRRMKIEQEVKKAGLGLCWFRDKKIRIQVPFSTPVISEGNTFSEYPLKKHLAENMYYHLILAFFTRCIDYKSNQKHLY